MRQLPGDITRDYMRKAEAITRNSDWRGSSLHLLG